ncbi:MAG: hypothetical protein AB7P02_00320 [Alphaproteobacteria bacterium]
MTAARPPRWRRLLPLVLLAVAGIAAAIASERLRDGGEAGTAAADVPAPRSYADIGEAGIVLVASGGRLVAYVDRRADNAPVIGGTASADVDGRVLAFAERARGVYVAESGTLAPGPHRIAFSFASDPAAGMVVMALNMPSGRPAAAVDGTESGSGRGIAIAGWILAVAAVAAGAVGFRALRRLG